MKRSGCGYNGLEIFAFLLFLVYLLQFLNDLLMNAMFNIMINGEQVSVFQALLLAFLGLYGPGRVVVSNNNNNNNNNNVRNNINNKNNKLLDYSIFFFQFQNNNNNNNNNNVSIGDSPKIMKRNE